MDHIRDAEAVQRQKWNTTKSGTKLKEGRKKQVTTEAQGKTVKTAEAGARGKKIRRNDIRAGKTGRGSKEAEGRRND